MCGRFYIPEVDDTPEALMQIMRQLEERMQQRQPGFRLKRGEICPGDTAAVVALSRRMQPSVFAMRWGFRVQAAAQEDAKPGDGLQTIMPGIDPPQKKTTSRLIINARSESADKKPLFRESMQMRRCLIPAAAYFEWDHRTAAMPKYMFSPNKQNIMYLAGLYRLDEWQQPEFTVLTREAAPAIACFHDRMPVFSLDPWADGWLDPQADPQVLLRHACTDLTWQQAI